MQSTLSGGLAHLWRCLRAMAGSLGPCGRQTRSLGGGPSWNTLHSQLWLHWGAAAA